MVRVTGADVAIGRLKGLAGQRKVELVGRALYAGGDMIRAHAIQSITEGSVSGKFHVPSKPGEPPNYDTGVLTSHIEVTQPEPLRVEVSSEAPYAVALEVGTSKMAARPYMGPAARAKRKEVSLGVLEAVNQALKRK